MNLPLIAIQNTASMQKCTFLKAFLSCDSHLSHQKIFFRWFPPKMMSSDHKLDGYRYQT